MEAYCLKCRAKREMQDEKKITMKNGKPATEGKCPVCGTRMFKIGAGTAPTKAAAPAKAAPAKAPAAKAPATKAAKGTKATAAPKAAASRRR